MNAERLTTLAEFLKTVPAKHFSMERWGLRGFEKHACGTTACAAGWACSIPKFKRAGLKMHYPLRSSSLGYPVATIKGEDGGEARILESSDALGAFFGLSAHEVCYIFGPEHERTPKQEARVILNFVKTGKVTGAETPTVVG